MSMLFETAEGREAWLSHAHEHGARYGSAMAHVSATNLGIWGNEDALKYDAAEIMLCELAAAFGTVPTELRNTFVQAVYDSTAFNLAFEHAREPNRCEVSEVASAWAGRVLPLARNPEDAPLYGEDLVLAISGELKRAPCMRTPLRATRARGLK